MSHARAGGVTGTQGALIERAYEVGLRALKPVVETLPLGGKLGQGARGRRGAVERLAAWSASSRRADVPLVWLHAPSVGEALMAQATVAALRTARPDVQVAFTYFSPSAERIADRVGADIADYLVWDTGPAVRAALAALRPGVLAFVRTEVWPILTREAARAGVRLAMINAVLPGDSSRLGPGARRLLGPAYRRLDAVGAVDANDAGRFTALGVAPDRTRVTGDARFDQVWARLNGAGGGRARIALDAAWSPAVVAGSTWPADEARLLPAFVALHARQPEYRLIIAPHEPTSAHLESLEARLDEAGLAHVRLSAVEVARAARAHDAMAVSSPDRDPTAGPADSGASAAGHAAGRSVLVVDRVGVLADLYAAGEIAYVGGGFGRDGLHSVIEPAAHARPVLMGPHHGGAGEAMRLAAAGGGFVMRDADALARRLLALAASSADRSAAGAAARAFVLDNLGGAERNARLLLELLDRG